MTEVDVLIVGAGAAGLMCGLTAGQRGRRVRVLDHAERPGKKILMSGGGRCNFTNTGTTPANFLSRNPHFCKSALARYLPEHFIAMVDRHGIGWHEKTPGQLFCNDSAKAIVRMLLDECAAVGTQVQTRTAITAIEQRDDGRFAVQTSTGTLLAESLVVATGGLSIPRMGATGFGYAIARQFGHGIVPTRAGLVPLTLGGPHAAALATLAGVSLPVHVHCGPQRFEDALLFTHRGASGPAILQISSYWEPGQPLWVDVLPQYTDADWLPALRRQHPDRALSSVLTDVLPRRFAQVLCDTWLAPWRAQRPLKQFDPPDWARLHDLLHRWPLPANGNEGYRTAEVTLGGVDTDQIASNTLESRRVPGLYFIGEVLDVTGWLGGYNFQWAWASGHAAGMVA
ncbi:MAG: aminoacetone oxidase family FAD-binding enzyme [Pseudoxanthomonas suwonensis]|nr:MAG: aminoacetone oxidase family FAD-binding enzyme [Pseudoxanthomonas suwonensis]